MSLHEKHKRLIASTTAENHPVPVSTSDPGLSAMLFQVASPKPPPLMKRVWGIASHWTLHRYRFILKLRQIGEDQLRTCGETVVTDIQALEAGIRIHNNKQTPSPELEYEIKKQARRYAIRLSEAREALVRQSSGE